MMRDPIERLERETHLRELAAVIPAGPWIWRQGRDGALFLWSNVAGNPQPIAEILAGVDLAKYLVELSPERLFA